MISSESPISHPNKSAASAANNTKFVYFRPVITTEGLQDLLMNKTKFNESSIFRLIR